jgi:hypothetical protein
MLSPSIPRAHVEQIGTSVKRTTFIDNDTACDTASGGNYPT